MVVHHACVFFDILFIFCVLVWLTEMTLLCCPSLSFSQPSGMTNRKDMIDEAILRPGRLEIHIEITLPSEPGRLQILNIKTLEMRNAKRTTEEVSSCCFLSF